MLEISVVPGETWETGDRLLQIEANGTPSTFNVAEFRVHGLRITEVVTLKKEEISARIVSGGYVPSSKKLVLR